MSTFLSLIFLLPAHVIAWFTGSYCLNVCIRQSHTALSLGNCLVVGFMSWVLNVLIIVIIKLLF